MTASVPQETTRKPIPSISHPVITIVSPSLSNPIEIKHSNLITIENLKSYLSEFQQINAKDAKFICFGKLLNDNDLVSSFVKDGKCTFHMVVSQSMKIHLTSSDSSATTSNEKLKSSSTVNSSESKTSAQPIPQYLPQSSTFAQLVFLNGIPYVMQYGTMPPSYPLNYPFSFGPPDNNILQQFQYSMMMNQQYQQGSIQQVEEQIQQPVVEQPPQNNHQPDDEFNDAVREAPPNALWLLLKLSFLVYIFSQNASWLRIVTLYVSALVIFLVQTRWVQFPNRRNVGRREVGVEGVQSDHDNNNVEEGEARGEVRNGWMQTLNSIVWGFISSLIPEQQEL